MSILLAGSPVFPSQQASAANLAAAQATQMLARAHAIQQKCKFLSANQNETLDRFVAKAEIAMVSKSSKKFAKSVIAIGRAQGRKAACSNAERADIVDILKAAHQAIAANTRTPVKQETRVAAKTVATKPISEPRQKPVRADRLERYAQLATRYYLARRCNTLSFGAINSLYNNVVITHRNVVSNFGVATVRSVMQQSEQRANQSSCG